MNLETSICTWKHHFQLGNIILSLETSSNDLEASVLFRKQTFPNEQLCFEVKSEFSKLKAMFPTLKLRLQINSKLCFQVNYYPEVRILPLFIRN